MTISLMVFTLILNEFVVVRGDKEATTRGRKQLLREEDGWAEHSRGKDFRGRYKE